MSEKMKLCSACLLGIPCRYDGTSKPNEKVLSLCQKEVLIPVCPEQLGGLPTPREMAERVEDRIKTRSGKDVTREFDRGAEAVVEIARLCGAREAILKQRSPSCGCGQIYDGTFSKTIVKGNGRTTEALLKEGIRVVSEEDI